MATKLKNEELDNVSGGGCSSKCSGCGCDLKHKHFYTCKYSVNPNNHSSHVDYKFCDSCYNRSDIKNNPCYWDWKAHLG